MLSSFKLVKLGIPYHFGWGGISKPKDIGIYVVLTLLDLCKGFIEKTSSNLMKAKALTYWNFKNGFKKTGKTGETRKTHEKYMAQKKNKWKKNKAQIKTILVYCKVWFQQSPNFFNAG